MTVKCDLHRSEVASADDQGPFDRPRIWQVRDMLGIVQLAHRFDGIPESRERRLPHPRSRREVLGRFARQETRTRPRKPIGRDWLRSFENADQVGTHDEDCVCAPLEHVAPGLSVSPDMLAIARDEVVQGRAG
jgi:hypothetical protein